MTEQCDAMAWTPGRHCDGCGVPLVGRAQRWCHGGCDDLYWTNHRWPRARAFRLLRARTRNRLGGLTYRCDHCGRTTTAPEVNHITPALGRHSHESCIHHQDNLEVLCRDCHAIVTATQRKTRQDGAQPPPRRVPRPARTERRT